MKHMIKETGNLSFNKRPTLWPHYDKDEVDIVMRVIESGQVNYWTGDVSRQFENEFSEWSGSKYAIALMNGTVALDVALKALNIGQGDEVIVTPRTFLASVSSIINVGAVPIFADVDRDSQNISIETILPKLSPKTKAIMCVHLAGWPCEMDPIIALAQDKEIFVIEDCAQAHGAQYKNQSVGSMGHISAWSFCQDKIITTGGEGGMVTTNDKDLWSFMWSYKDHGKSWESVYEKEHPPGFRWLHDSFGTNYRMLEIQAAIGRIQLTKMYHWHQQRLQNANQIWETARRIPGLRSPIVPDHMEHAAYKCYIFVEPERLKSDWSRDRIMAEINSYGVPCYSGSCSEVYLEKAFDGSGFRPAHRLANAKELGETSLMFLVHPTLTDNDMQKTCDSIKKVMSHAVR